MYIPFETLIEQLGRSIQGAQEYLDQQAADSFFRCFKTVNQSSGSLEVPITRRVGLPTGDGESLRSVDVPTAALLQHQAMSLDTVKVRLHLNTQTREEDKALLVEPCFSGDDQDGVGNTGEVELVFKFAPPAEGIARLDLNLQKVL